MSQASLTVTDRDVRVNIPLADMEDVSVALQDARCEVDLDDEVLADALNYVVENVDPDEIDDALYSIARPLLQEWANRLGGD